MDEQFPVEISLRQDCRRVNWFYVNRADVYFTARMPMAFLILHDMEFLRWQAPFKRKGKEKTPKAEAS